MRSSRALVGGRIEGKANAEKLRERFFCRPDAQKRVFTMLTARAIKHVALRRRQQFAGYFVPIGDAAVCDIETNASRLCNRDASCTIGMRNIEIDGWKSRRNMRAPISVSLEAPGTWLNGTANHRRQRTTQKPAHDPRSPPPRPVAQSVDLRPIGLAQRAVEVSAGALTGLVELPNGDVARQRVGSGDAIDLT